MRAGVGALLLAGTAVLGAAAWWRHDARAGARDTALIAPPVSAHAAPGSAGSRAPQRPGSVPVLPRRGTTSRLPGLARDLRDPDPAIRRAAMHEAGRDPDTDVRVLLAGSRDADFEVSFAATAALGDRYAAGEVPVGELVDRATDHVLPERVRVIALDSLARATTTDAAALFERLLRSGDVTERRSAALLIATQDRDIAMPALITALGDSDEYVQSNALSSLRRGARGRDFATDAAAWRAWWQSQR